MKTKFFLNEPNKEHTSIMMSVHHKSKRAKFGLSIPVKTVIWDQDGQRVKGSSMDSLDINRRLRMTEQKVTEFYLNRRAANKETNIEHLKSYIKQLLGRQKEEHRELSFFDYFQQFIDESVEQGRVKSGTIKNYRNTLRHLKNFSKKKNLTITFETIDSDMYHAFLKHLTTGKDRIANNSAGNQIKNLKKFLNWALDKDLHNNTKFSKVLKVNNKDAEQFALTEEEVKKIEALDTKGNKSLERTRDAFLFETYTGMRYSDFSALDSEHISLKEGRISLYTEKTETPIKIPIHDRLRGLLEKYPDRKIPVITNQKYDKRIKEVCKAAGIDSPVVKTQYFGRKKVETKYKKYELCASHTARRSFITIAIRLGMKPESIMKVTGISKYETLKKYINLADSQVENDMLDAWGKF